MKEEGREETVGQQSCLSAVLDFIAGRSSLCDTHGGREKEGCCPEVKLVVEGKAKVGGKGVDLCAAPVLYYSLFPVQTKWCVTCCVREVCVAVGRLLMVDSSSSAIASEPTNRCSDAFAASVLPRRTSQ